MKKQLQVIFLIIGFYYAFSPSITSCSFPCYKGDIPVVIPPYRYIMNNSSYSLFKGSLSLSTEVIAFQKCRVLYHLLSPLLNFIRHL
nr:MAG TPA: hypothetical protein [Bacteriophage sp.]